MTWFKKHSSILLLGAVVAFGFYQMGHQAGENSFSSRAPNLANVSEGAPSEVDFSPFWKAWNLINEKYVGASTTAETVGDQEKVYGAIGGLTSSLGDPYTSFLPPVEAELFESDIRGNFEGVGMEVLAQNGAVTVISPLKDSPAERAGIQAGDKVIGIDSTPTTNLTTEDAVQLIRGQKGTQVSLTIFREGSEEPLEIKVTRDTINIPTLNTRTTPEGVFVIELYSFSAPSPNLFRSALREFILSGSDKLVLDLRGNPGGYLEAAIDMASRFLPASKVIVREDFGGRKEARAYRSRGYDIFDDNLKFAILVNQGSASASEILAGALQEHNKAVVIGQKTFGKGSVQELIDLTENTSIKITVARWLTPNGLSISETGVVPDHVVEYTLEDRNAGRDPQMQKAIEILMK